MEKRGQTFLPAIQTCKTFRQHQRYRLHAMDWCSVCPTWGSTISVPEATNRTSSVPVAIFMGIPGPGYSIVMRIVACIGQIIGVNYPIKRT
jgi:hypothetical protein